MNDTTEIEKNMRKYYQQVYAKMLDNLKETDESLETFNLLRLNPKETENLNRQITTKEIEAVIRKLPAKQKSWSDHLTGEFYQTFQEELNLTLLKLLLKKFKRTKVFQAYLMRPALS